MTQHEIDAIQALTNAQIETATELRMFRENTERDISCVPGLCTTQAAQGESIKNLKDALEAEIRLRQSDFRKVMWSIIGTTTGIIMLGIGVIIEFVKALAAKK